MKRLLPLILFSSLLAGCGHGSSVASDPPADHGGYAGPAAHWYDAAYTDCYRQLGRMMRQHPATGWTWTMELPGRLLAQPGAASYMAAMNAGCSAGAKRLGGAAGMMGDTLSSPST